MVWPIVARWPMLARDTVGKQLVRAADSVWANTAEGYGRQSFQDNKRFVRIARGSLGECRFWLRRAHQRQLLPADEVVPLKAVVHRLGPLLNGYLRSIGADVKKATRPSTDEQPITNNR